ncbi:uncharacterized protein LOC144123634 [Amblyomma americanum]
MTGCCVPLCTGSWKKGLRTFRFPRDPERRKKWEAQVEREKWKATDTSKICERHFEPDQYENARQDGRRLLKSTAVPTLFDFRPQPKRRKPPVRRRSLADSATSATESFQSTDVASPGSSSLNDQELDTGELCISDSTEEEEQEGHCDILDVDSLSTSEMRKALQDMQKKNSQLKESLSVAKKKMRTATRQAAKLETKVTMLTANLKYLNEDQKTALERQDRTCRTWSADTVKNALQLKFACGSTGYDLLIEQGYPLPSRRTLCRRLQHLSFKPGVLHEILSAMQTKISSMKDIEKDCILFLDEMEIRSGIELDRGNDTLLGMITLPSSDQPAKHALVFMVGGTNTRWKQVIAFHYTGAYVSGDVLKDFVFHLIKLCTDIGLRVRCVTSDMRSSNHAMWRSLNLSSSRNAVTVSSVPHPFISNETLHFMPDPAHVLKNVRGHFVRKDPMHLSSEIVSRFNSPTTEITVEHRCMGPFSGIYVAGVEVEFEGFGRVSLAALFAASYELPVQMPMEGMPVTLALWAPPGWVATALEAPLAVTGGCVNR